MSRSRYFVDPLAKKKSAKGSEHFAWKLYPGVPHVCWSCARDLKRDDVAEVRTRYPSHKTEFLCTACRDDFIRIQVEGNRARLESTRPSSRS